jgi:hypothetical protein
MVVRCFILIGVVALCVCVAWHGVCATAAFTLDWDWAIGSDSARLVSDLHAHGAAEIYDGYSVALYGLPASSNVNFIVQPLQLPMLSPYVCIQKMIMSKASSEVEG